MLRVSVELTHAGASLSKMIRIQLLASISLTLPRMWLWFFEKCVFAHVHDILYQRGGVLLLGALLAAYI